MEFGIALCLVKEPKEFHLMVDCSSKGCGYVVIVGEYKKGKVVRLNSKLNKEDSMSSYLSEF